MPLAGCALAAPAPPDLRVVSVELRDLDLLDQQFAVVLCVRNLDRSDLAFRQVSATLDVAGAMLARGISDAAIHVPAHAAMLVPLTVATSVRHLGPQLLDVLSRGELDYRVHGAVTLEGPFPFAVPFSRSGQFDPLGGVARLLADTSGPAGCEKPA